MNAPLQLLKPVQVCGVQRSVPAVVLMCSLPTPCPAKLKTNNVSSTNQGNDATALLASTLSVQWAICTYTCDA